MITIGFLFMVAGLVGYGAGGAMVLILQGPHVRRPELLYPLIGGAIVAVLGLIGAIIFGGVNLWTLV